MIIGQEIESSATPSMDVSALIRRRLDVLIGGLLIGTLIAFGYALTAPQVFESESKVLVVDKDANLATHSVEARFGEELLATHLQIMSSRRIVEDAVKDQNLLELPGLQKAIADEVAEAESDLDAVVTYIIDNLDVNQGGEGRAKGAQVLRAAFQHSSSSECQVILAAVVDSYQKFLNETVYGADDEAATLISEASEDIERRVTTLENSYRQFREEAPIFWRRDGTSVNPHEMRLNDIEESLSQLWVRKAEVQSRLEVVESYAKENSANADTDLQQLSIVDASDIDRLSLLLQTETGHPLSEQFQAAQPIRVETASAEFDRLLALELEKHKVNVGSRHPKVVELDSQIEQLRTFLANRKTATGPAGEPQEGATIRKLAEVYARLLKHDVADFERRAKSLSVLAEQERNKAKELVRLELKEESLRNASERARALHNSVIDRLNEINLLKDHGGFISQVINPVRLGELAWPNIPLIVAFGAMLGSLVGLGVALILEVSDRSFRSSEEVFQQLRVPVMVHVPFFKPVRKRLLTEDCDRRLCVVHRPESLESEAIRTFRAAILSSFPSNSVIQVSSPNGGSGTSTVVANLAVSMAKAGQRVLLIDANLRHPTQMQLFELESSVGLSSVLEGTATVDEAVQRMNGIPKLDVISSGMDQLAGELLASPLLSELFAFVRNQYDFVLVDGPSVLTCSDSLSIAAQSDFVVLNISPSRDSLDAATASMRKLASISRKPVAGVVVNKSEWSDCDAAAYFSPVSAYERSFKTKAQPRNGRKVEAVKLS